MKVSKGIVNIRVIIWFMLNFIFYLVIANFMLGQNLLKSVHNSIMMCLIAVGFAISPLGELLIRIRVNARPLLLKREIDRLEPLFHEVYEIVKEKDSQIGDKVKLYIIDTWEINMYSYGYNTIIITRGCLNYMSNDEIKAVLAHEFGHIVNGDTIRSILFRYGNVTFIFTLTISILYEILKRLSHSDSFLMLVKRFFDFLFFITAIFGMIIIAPKKEEYKADLYSFRLGYGDSLISLFYKYYDDGAESEKTIKERLLSMHPNLVFRIAELESHILISSKFYEKTSKKFHLIKKYKVKKKYTVKNYIRSKTFK